MRLITNITTVLLGTVIPFYASAWNLPVGDFEIEAVTENVYVMHAPQSQPNVENRGFMNNSAFVEARNGLILIDPGNSLQVGDKILEDYGIKKRVVSKFEHMRHWSEFDGMFDPNLNKMYLELEAF